MYIYIQYTYHTSQHIETIINYANFCKDDVLTRVHNYDSCPHYRNINVNWAYYHKLIRKMNEHVTDVRTSLVNLYTQ